MAKCGAAVKEMLDVYMKFEFGIPVWSSTLKKKRVSDIERVNNQKK